MKAYINGLLIKLEVIPFDMFSAIKLPYEANVPAPAGRFHAPRHQPCRMNASPQFGGLLEAPFKPTRYRPSFPLPFYVQNAEVLENLQHV
jgi:hypothetical protein